MQDLALGHAGAEFVALLARYPWQAFAVVLSVVRLVKSLLSNDASRGTCGDFDLGLFGGDADGGDGGGD
jgi:hypothetical protein